MIRINTTRVKTMKTSWAAYGVGINDIQTANDGELPSFLQELFKQLRERGSEVEQLFLKDMSLRSYQRYTLLKNKLRQGKLAKLEKYKPRILAALLVNWTKHQPDAVMGHIQLWLATVGKLQAWQQQGHDDDGSSLNNLINEIKHIISCFPLVTQAFLKGFMALLHDVSVKNIRSTLVDGKQLARRLEPVLWHGRISHKKHSKQDKKSPKSPVDGKVSREQRTLLLEVMVKYADRIFNLKRDTAVNIATHKHTPPPNRPATGKINLTTSVKVTRKLLEATGLFYRTKQDSTILTCADGKGKLNVVTSQVVKGRQLGCRDQHFPRNAVLVGDMTICDLEQDDGVAAEDEHTDVQQASYDVPRDEKYAKY